MKLRTLLIHSGLFIATFFTTTVAGITWLNVDPFDLSNFTMGLHYSIPVLFILTCHEFGHYFAARFHKVEATLPFYIPMPFFMVFLSFGTFGAVIKTRSLVPSKKAMFDIGVAGPIAGFIATIIVLVYGFTHLPGKEFILLIHPDYFTAEASGTGLRFGSTLLYDLLSFTLTDSANDFIPPMTEMYHYPYLLAGWFGLFITSMNLIPAGQLDGGHLSYTMFGDRHSILAKAAFGIITLLGLSGIAMAAGIEIGIGWYGWILWSIIIFFVVKLDHPAVGDETELDPVRRLIGWGVFGILVLTFSPSPFNM